MTNYEKIKNMSVEEMADFLCGRWCHNCDYCDGRNESCLEERKQFLESEAVTD